MTSSQAGAATRKLLVLDTAYALEAILERHQEESITCRDLDGFFAHVWSVHPFATLVTSETWGPRYGPPVQTELAARHTLIEGRIGRYEWLKRIAPLNFLLSQIGLFRMLRRLIKREGICVIRVGEPLYLGLFGLALGRLCGIPLVVRVGANNEKIRRARGQAIMPRLFFSRRLERITERYILPRADLVAAVNQDNLEYALDFGARADRSTIFRYGNLIDKRHIVPPAERRGGKALCDALGVEPKRFVMCIGRLVIEKHPDDTVRALSQVRRAGHNVKLLLVGDGGMRSQLEALATHLGVSDQVVFCGNRDQAWLAAMIPLACAVLSPITGRALTEAAFGGAPIVAYDIDWQREMIQDGITGALVPYRSHEAMAEALMRLLDDPNYAATMGRAARNRAHELLDPVALNQHEREQYQLLIERYAAERRRRPAPE